MEIRHLECFVAVAEEANFTKAAARLHVVQSAVSASVKALEREFGAILFARNSRTVMLTTEGKTLLPLARKVIAAAEETLDAVASLRGTVRGTVAVGLLATRDFLGIPDALVAFRHKHPDVVVTARTSPTGGLGIMEALLAETLDVSLVVLPLPPHPDIEFDELVAGQLMLAVGEGHPLATRENITTQDLDGLDLVMLPPGFSLRMSIESELAKLGIRYRTTIEIADQALVTEYIRAGLGAGFVAQHDAALVPGLVTLPVRGLDLRWSAAIATKRGRHRSAATLAMMEELRQRAIRLAHDSPHMSAVASG
ncbi:DNA-binding transcriptional LysR family regulator [Microbacteriaceae bacterium SG_E_30_P1]|uniref:DNA-binding transcriptional LysR family regulator n=1 Tax=Antiquaquibacter oligotrophicus TaxID=2880260 RepID=A0ABT6KP90_9MICO|nr:LysR family transcriptional regulator [Antiquaquibacter oligotrophicus]MDH6181616.1 DNA-binding transcriptional LysR family regulator [Antiquaquibacter oligotrophicus]UDF12699.1 LysR family transcriptional regulator [Antiquaquibacter oligotrophicus]